MSPKTAAPRSEKGYVVSMPGWMGPLDPFELVPELMWPNSVHTYARMAREDARVASVLRAIGLPIRRTAWRIRQNGASDKVTAFIAMNLGLPIEGDSDDTPTTRTRDRFSWQQHLQLALASQQYGHAVFEQVYRLDGTGKNMRAVLHKLAPRPQSSISYWNVGSNGDLISVQQWPAGTFNAPGMIVLAPTAMGEAIPMDRLVVYTRDMDPGVWTGNSLLRPAFKHWKLKDELIRVEAAAARRHGIGVPWIKGNEADSEDTVRMDELLDTISKYSGGASAGLALTDGEEAGIMAPSGTPMDPRSAIEYHDHQIAIVALAHFLNLDGKGGSYALASTQADTFVQSVQTVANDIREVAQAHIIEDLVDLNFGPDEPTPLLVFDEIGSRQDATAAALNLLALAGLITPDDRLESAIRQSAGLPSPDPDTARAEPDPVAPADPPADHPAAPVAPRPQPAKPAAVKVAAHLRRKPGAQLNTNGGDTLW